MPDNFDTCAVWNSKVIKLKSVFSRDGNQVGCDS